MARWLICIGIRSRWNQLAQAQTSGQSLLREEVTEADISVAISATGIDQQN